MTLFNTFKSYASNVWGSIIEKLNPAQDRIAQDAGTSIYSDGKITFRTAFDKLEAVNRSVSMVINACASLDYDVKDSLPDRVVVSIRKKQVENLLNFRPNPYQSAQDFRKNIFTDYILEGNAFIYFDGAFMYHLPAANVEILTDPITFIKGYKYNGSIDFTANEIFSFKDISSTSIYRGSSRLRSAEKAIETLYSMHTFQENFFANGAVFGLVLTSDNTLSKTAKENTINNWIQKYNPKMGGKRPVILDSGLKPVAVSQTSFKDMDFDVAIKTHSEKIMTAVGVPPILLAGGNNANITPNLRLFYLETILPIIRSYTSALERFYGYDIEAVTNSVSALQPEGKDRAEEITTLVNNGLYTLNEGRIELRMPVINDPKYDIPRDPKNITGSATDPSVGGRPEGTTETEESE